MCEIVPMNALVCKHMPMYSNCMGMHIWCQMANLNEQVFSDSCWMIFQLLPFELTLVVFLLLTRLVLDHVLAHYITADTAYSFTC